MKLDIDQDNKNSKNSASNRRASRSQGKKPDKMTSEEIASLQKNIAMSNNLLNQRATICVEKEMQIRNINESFNDEWERLEIAIKSNDDKREELLDELHKKYGNDKAFDIDTGQITKQDARNNQNRQ